MLSKRIIAAAILPLILFLVLGNWPKGDSKEQDVQATLRRVKQNNYHTSWHWHDKLIASQLADLPLYGQLINFQTTDAVDTGIIGLVEVKVPEASPSRIWMAMLDDGALLARRALDFGLDGVYLVFVLDSGECNSPGHNHSHHYPVFVSYIVSNIKFKSGPFPGAELINTTAMWDRALFKSIGGE